MRCSGQWVALICFFGVLVYPPSVIAQQASSRTIKIPDGTAVRLSLMDGLSSATNKADDPIHFEVTEDVKVGEVVALPKGSTAAGHVVLAEPKRRMGRAANLDLSVDYVKAPDGTNVRLTAVCIGGKEKIGTHVTGTVSVAPVFLMNRGGDVNVSKGTQFNVCVDGDRQIALGGPVTGPATPQAASDQPAAARRPAPAGNLSTVVLKSTPDGADVTMDGKYMGSTPSTVRLPSGDHTISVEKAGFKTWQRTMTVSAGSIVTIDATLEKNP